MFKHSWSLWKNMHISKHWKLRVQWLTLPKTISIFWFKSNSICCHPSTSCCRLSRHKITFSQSFFDTKLWILCNHVFSLTTKIFALWSPNTPQHPNIFEYNQDILKQSILSFNFIYSVAFFLNPRRNLKTKPRFWILSVTYLFWSFFSCAGEFKLGAVRCRLVK